MWRTWRSPIMPASCASAGIAFCTAGAAATSAWRTMAPMLTELASPDSALRSPMAARSMRSLGDERRSFIACTRLCPPARKRPSVFCVPSARASFRLDGRWYSNACMAFLLGSFFLKGAPHGLGGGRHGDILDPERIGDRVDHRGRSADRARLAAAFHAERVVRARRLARIDAEGR